MMSEPLNSERLTSSQSDASWGVGLYLYCVANSPERRILGRMGLGGTVVYTIPFGDVCAVVHRCSARPYGSRNLEVVRTWALTHQRVVDTARRRWGIVLPSTFNAVFLGRDDGDAAQAVREWLAAEYHDLRDEIARVRGKTEYGVQVFWDFGVGGEGQQGLGLPFVGQRMQEHNLRSRSS